MSLVSRLFRGRRDAVQGSGRLPAAPPSEADMVALRAVGHLDESPPMASGPALKAIISEVYLKGFRTGGIFQTVDAGSAGHIEVIGNVNGKERLVGWIAMQPGDEQTRFQCRLATTPLEFFRTRADWMENTPSLHEPNDWTMTSLAELLKIAEAANFKVCGICQDEWGDRAHIQIELGEDGKWGRGRITAETIGPETFYRLQVTIGPKIAPPPVEDDD